jgi:hypothetical protein
MMPMYERTTEQPRLHRLIQQAAPLLTCILIACGSLQPFFSGQVPLGADTALHFFRIAAWDRLWSQGIFYTQWIPDFALGYGYPLMNYHPPLAYYLGVVMYRLGLSLPHAMLAAWVLSAVVASTGMYQWVRSLSNSTLAGVVAAVAYSFAPYTLYNIFTRGGFAESIAISFAPWLFFAIHRYTAQRRIRDGLLLTACFTAIMLSHVIASLLVAPVAAALVVVGAWHWHAAEARGRVGAFLGTVLGGAFFLALALALSAFFWLPPQFELGLVQMARGTSGYADFSAHFLALAQLLALPNPVDPNFVGQYVPASLSWVALLLALPALLHIARVGRLDRQVPALFLALLAFVAACMTLPLSQVVWDHLSILRYLQYPFRFLGLATLAVSALAGLGFAALDQWLRVHVAHAMRFLAPALFVCVAGFAVYAYTWQIAQPDPLANSPHVSMSDVWQAEQKLGTIGTTSFGEYLPRDVLEMPTTPAVSDADHPDRLDAAGLPQGATVSNAVYGPLTYDLDVQAPQAFTATFRTFYFPGWWAIVDGISAPITPSTPNGLIQVTVPAGQHHVHVSFGSTPIRTFSADVSLAALLMMGGGGALLGFYQQRKKKELVLDGDALILQRRSLAAPGAQLSARATLGLMSVVLLALALAGVVKSVLVDERPTPFKWTRLVDHRVQGASDDFDVNFGNALHLIGGDIPSKTVKAGQTLNFSLYWQLYQPTTSDYSVKTDVVSARGVAFGQYDTAHPNGIFPTSRFTPTDYLLDERHIAIAADAPPGVYQVKASVYHNGEPGNRLTVLDRQGAPIGTTYEATALTIFTITVERPDQPIPLAQVQPATPVNQPVSAGVTLIGHSLPAQLSLHVGDSFSLDTYWHATQVPGADFQACFDLLSAAQQVALDCEAPVPGLPTSQWYVGDVWRSTQAMRIPPALAGGVYTLTLRSAAGAGVFISRLNVSAPARNDALPAGVLSQTNHFTNGISLAAYALPEGPLHAGQVLTVSLYWRTDREIDARLKVFVHLQDAAHNRVAGNDQTPGDVRPTTDWVPGEYVADVHAFALPAELAPGDYHLLVGLYDEGNLQRVPLDDGKDALTLETPITVAH